MHIGTGWMLCKPICCQTSWPRPLHPLKDDTRCTHSLMSLSDSPRDLMICHWNRRLPVLAATLLWTCLCKEEQQRGTEERVTAHSCSSLTPLGNIHKYAIGHSTVPHGTLTGLYRQYMVLTGGCIGNTLTEKGMHQYAALVRLWGMYSVVCCVWNILPSSNWSHLHPLQETLGGNQSPPFLSVAYLHKPG